MKPDGCWRRRSFGLLSYPFPIVWLRLGGIRASADNLEQFFFLLLLFGGEGGGGLKEARF